MSGTVTDYSKKKLGGGSGLVFYSLLYHYAATKGLVRLGLPQKIIGLYFDLLFTCFVFVSVKPWKQTHVREGGIC